MLKIRKKGISHRKVHMWLVIIILFFSGTVVFSTFRLTNTFLDITTASKQNTELQNAAHELMNASDYLTEQVQRFTIDGDEIVVFMMHAEGLQRKLIEAKIEQIRTMLENTEDGLPPISLSMGIVNGKDAKDTTDLFEKADQTMYESKKHGKGTYTFY